MAHDFLKVLFTIFIVMDPIGIIPSFMALAGHYDAAARKRIIVKAVLIAALVLAVFVAGGRVILHFFGIQSGAFYISGGIIFFIIAFEMIYNKPTSRRVPPGGEAERDEAGSEFIAIFPLAIPMIAGPGLISVVMTFMTGAHSWLYSLALVAPAIIICLVCMFIVLRASATILRVLGTTGIFVMEKIMGIILAGFAVQLIYNGLVALGVVPIQ